MKLRQPGLLRGGNAWQRRVTLKRSDSVGLDGPTLYLRNHIRDGVAQNIDLTADQCVHGGCGAVERHEGRPCTSDRVEKQAEGERQGADARMGDVQLVGVRLHISEEFPEVFRRKILPR